MADKSIKANDQLVSRVIRQAIARFQNAETTDDKLAAVMAMSAISAVSIMTDRQFISSTLKYIQGRLS